MVMLVKFLIGCIIVGVITVILLMVIGIKYLDDEIKSFEREQGLYDDVEK